MIENWIQNPWVIFIIVAVLIVMALGALVGVKRRVEDARLKRDRTETLRQIQQREDTARAQDKR